MKYEFFIATRYLMSKKHTSFLSFITLISILGVILGVTALCVVISVMEGLETELKTKILGASSHIHMIRLGAEGISDYGALADKIGSIDNVSGAIPTIMREGLVVSKEGITAGIFIKGVDMGRASGVEDFNKIIRKRTSGEAPGNLKYLENTKIGEAKKPTILVGNELARDLLLSEGDEVSLLVPYGEITPFGNMPRKKKFTVAGIFHSGMWEYDSKFIYMALPEMQKFLTIPDVSNGIEVYLKDVDKTVQTKEQIVAATNSEFYVRDWRQIHGNLFDALRLEKTTMFVILTMIVLVASFNIVATLIMAVKDKAKDIAILRSMGAQKTSIMKIFMIEGLTIGAIGTAIGVLFGMLLAIILRDFIAFPLNPDVYYISTLPVKMSPVNFIIISFSSMVISFLATIYPAYQASKLEPVEGLRYE